MRGVRGLGRGYESIFSRKLSWPALLVPLSLGPFKACFLLVYVLSEWTAAAAVAISPSTAGLLGLGGGLPSLGRRSVDEGSKKGIVEIADAIVVNKSDGELQE